MLLLRIFREIKKEQEIITRFIDNPILSSGAHSFNATPRKIRSPLARRIIFLYGVTQQTRHHRFCDELDNRRNRAN